MCKHILNAQTIICSPCCQRWYECAECHDEKENHTFGQSRKLRFTCKKCKKCFDRDFLLFPESDKKCDFCGNMWCISAITPESKVFQESINTLDEYLNNMLNTSSPYFTTFTALNDKG